MADDALVYDRPWEGRFTAAAFLADEEEHLLIQDMNIMGARLSNAPSSNSLVRFQYRESMADYRYSHAFDRSPVWAYVQARL